MKIKIIRDFVSAETSGRNIKAGETLEVSNDYANDLVRFGIAVVFKQEKKTAEVKPEFLASGTKPRSSARGTVRKMLGLKSLEEKE